MKILFTGGGSGGHIFPIVAIAREIKRIIPRETKLLYMGPNDDWVSLYLSQEDIEIKPILSGKIRRYLSLESVCLNIVDIFKLIIGFFQSVFLLFFENPDVIFSKGGYGSMPVVFAGKMIGIPIFSHESDACPGIANKLTSKFALKIFTSFPKTEYLDPEKIILTGNPIRREIFGGSRKESSEMFHLTKGRPVLLILGGSQGSQRINDIILLILPELLKEFEVIHQCGVKNLESIKKESLVVVPKKIEKYYHPFGFLKEQEIREAYYACDIIISRAGAGSIFEIANLGKPSILIPLPESAQDHQFKNAYAFAENGASLVIEESNLTPKFFLENLRLLMSKPETMRKMSQSAKEFSRPRAAKVIAQYILEYLMS